MEKEGVEKNVSKWKRGWTRLERLLSWRVEREGHGEEKNAIAINFFFLNFKFYLMKFLFLELKDRHDGKLKKILDVFEN